MLRQRAREGRDPDEGDAVPVAGRAGPDVEVPGVVADRGAFLTRRGADLEPLLAIGCPTIIYPYARETLSDLVTRGGFPPVLLAPVSFEALYAQRAQQQSGPDSRIEVSS